MELEIIKVARKIQVVEAFHFEKPPQIWGIAQWMKAHQINAGPMGCVFVYNFQNEQRTLYVKRNDWLVLDESGFAAHSEIEFVKKFIVADEV